MNEKDVKDLSERMAEIFDIRTEPEEVEQQLAEQPEDSVEDAVEDAAEDTVQEESGSGEETEQPQKFEQQPVEEAEQPEEPDVYSSWAAFARPEAQREDSTQGGEKEEEVDWNELFYDEKAAGVVRDLYDQVRTLRREIEVLRSLEEQRATRQLISDVERARRRFLEKHPELDENELNRLGKRAAEEGLFDARLAATGDPYEAAFSALELAYRSDEIYEQRLSERILANIKEREKQALERKQKAAALSPGGSVPQPEPPRIPENMTTQQFVEFMKQRLEEQSPPIVP